MLKLAIFDIIRLYVCLGTHSTTNERSFRPADRQIVKKLAKEIFRGRNPEVHKNLIEGKRGEKLIGKHGVKVFLRDDKRCAAYFANLEAGSVDVSVLYARQQKILSELALIDERLGQIEREAATKVSMSSCVAGK